MLLSSLQPELPKFGTEQLDWCKLSCLKDDSNDFQPYLYSVRVAERFFNAPVHLAGLPPPQILHRMLQFWANKQQESILFLQDSIFIIWNKVLSKMLPIFENIQSEAWILFGVFKASTPK